jgi:hypothetical protein
MKAGYYRRKRRGAMYEMISYCGIDCSGCPAYLATQADDMEALARVAEEWSEQFGMEIPPESIICDSCKTGEDARRSGYCSICGVRTCAVGKGVATWTASARSKARWHKSNKAGGWIIWRKARPKNSSFTMNSRESLPR